MSEYEPPSVDGEKAKVAQKNAEKRQSAEMIEFTNAYEKLSEQVQNGTLEYVSVAEMMKELKIKSKKTFMRKAENLDVFDFEKRTNQLGGDASPMVVMITD